MASDFKYLFTPIRIGKKTAKNRVVCSAHWSLFGSGLTGYDPYTLRGETSDDRYVSYLEEKARGGCGTIVTRTCGVGFPGAGYYFDYAPPAPERLSETCKKIAEACHKHGSLAILQIGGFGKNQGDMVGCFPKANHGFSPIPDVAGSEMPHVMEIEEIEGLIDLYVATAKAVKGTGIDGIEFQGSEGTIIQQSYSPADNIRDDKYGDLLAFLTELINGVRTEIGPDMILALKMAADDMWPKEMGGLGNEGLVEHARRLDKLGKLDMITTAHNKCPADIYKNIPTMHFPIGVYLPLDAEIKKAVKNIVVAATGRIKDPVQAEKALADGLVDMVAMARGLIADPHWARKALEGRLDDIKPCIACNQGCLDRLYHNVPVTCTQNPSAGREHESKGTIEPCLDRARNKKKVVVVGGGPAGMEAARVAAERGHDVTLYEKDKELGGQINIFTRVPVRGEFADVVRYRNIQLQKLGVKVNLGVEATAGRIITENADVVVIATGSAPLPPGIPGINQDNVLSASDVLLGTRPIGDRVIIYDMELRQKAATIAEFLVDQGKKVEIVTPYPTPAMWVGPTNICVIKSSLLQKGVTFIPHTRVLEISDKTLAVIDVNTYQTRVTGGFDTFVYCTYNRANDHLYKELKGKVRRLELIGDAWGPRSVMHAINDAFYLAREI